MLEELLGAPGEVKARVCEAAVKKREECIRRKRAHYTQTNSQRAAKKARTNQQGEAANTPMDEAPLDPLDDTLLGSYLTEGSGNKQVRDVDKFLDLPTEEQLRDCYRSFLDATSSEALVQGVCASCARRFFQRELTRVDYLTLENRALLVPATPHFAHVLTEGMLLETSDLAIGNGKVIGWICNHCHCGLKRNHLPAYTLANNMWVGVTPPALASLTIPERLLIALHYSRGFIFKLYPRGRGGDHPDALQMALRGNVTTYTANVQDVVQMLEGQLMPRTTSILPSLIAIAFVGRTRVISSRFKSLFRVRRSLVHQALLELKYQTRHPGYCDIEINANALDSLPENGIPDEILATIRYEDNEGIVEKESAGYVPTESEEFSLDNQLQQAQDGEINMDEATVEGELGEADVIPLEYSGTSAADGSHITPKELMFSAIKNLHEELGHQMLHEGGYAVRHGGFARDFGQPRPGNQECSSEDTGNPSTSAFPWLFPFGVGGIEDKRLTPVSFSAHARYLMMHCDDRFRKDQVLPYWVLGILQKRQAMGAVKLVMNRRDFDRVSSVLSGLTEDDLRKAAEEEEAGTSSSSPKVSLLRKMVQITMQKIMGSDASRALNRSKIWSTSLYLNPANLWMTLNFVDRHDPICQVFAGENVNMERLDDTIHLSAHQRAKNVAEDPFAASKFFFFLANTILETLFGFSPRARLDEGRMGALGLGNAYFGVVEAQGRGSLHLHMLMWLKNSPNAEEIVSKLQSEPFRNKIVMFVKANIRSHLDNLTENVLSTMESTPGLAWSRPPNPDGPGFNEEMRLLETRLVRSQQFHTCGPNTCLVYDKSKRHMVCKRRAPFPLSPDDMVTELGEVRTKRLIGQLNAWCPAIFYGGRCNNDIKFLTNGAETRSISWYTTHYATKKQGRSFNRSAILARTYLYNEQNMKDPEDSRKKNQTFILRCGLSLNREMEYSSQQVMALIMGDGDTIHSHTYTAIYWSSIVRAIKDVHHELDPKHTEIVQSQNQQSEKKPDEDQALHRIGIRGDGSIYLRSQLDDYQYRSPDLEEVNFIDYFVTTYEEGTRTYQDDDSNEYGESALAHRRGRRKHQRFLYQSNHPRATTAQRVLRPDRHRNLPDIIGPWIERNDNEATYDLHCASALALLKPWRTLADLKPSSQSWANALEEFLASADDKPRCIYANIQHYYECRDSADKTATNDSKEENVHEDEVVTQEELSELVNGVTVEKLLISDRKRKELAHADAATAIGESLGMFAGPETTHTLSNNTDVAHVQDYEDVEKWTNALREIGSERRRTSKGVSGPVADQGGVDQLSMNPQLGTPADPSVTYESILASPPQLDVDVSMLSPEQLQAYQTVIDHVTRMASGENVPQLLMQIQGEGGTGKSLVIAKITEYFVKMGLGDILLRSALTGIAASLIEGSTLHSLALLHLASKHLSKTSIERLRATWGPVKYLIIDEVSMVSKDMLYLISKMIGIGKQVAGENNSTVAFGGICVILVGDFHQFPPVVGVGQGRGALYTPGTKPKAENKAQGSKDTPSAKGEPKPVDRDLYDAFTTVVILKKQHRIEDRKWQDILHRSRYGQCTEEDVAEIRALVLDPKRDSSLFQDGSPWHNATLVTPRHTVRIRWNELASRRHCLQTGQKLIRSRSYYTHDGGPLDGTLQKLVNARVEDGRKNDFNGLPDEVPLAIGMQVMVTYNIETELDVANGARGTVERIIIHDGSVDQELSDIKTTVLTRPPACVLVCLARTKARAIDGLEEGIVPIVPMRARLSIDTGKGKRKTVWREQLPLTPAYAFTDYRSQGQTLPYVIIDLGTPPSGGLTPFNAYVALSRSKSRKTVRLLRDFNPELFTTPPSEHLLREDQRLEDLDQRTKQLWSLKQGERTMG